MLTMARVWYGEDVKVSGYYQQPTVGGVAATPDQSGTTAPAPGATGGLSIVDVRRLPSGTAEIRYRVAGAEYDSVTTFDTARPDVRTAAVNYAQQRGIDIWDPGTSVIPGPTSGKGYEITGPVTVIPMGLGGESFQTSRDYLSQIQSGTPVRFENSPSIFIAWQGGLTDTRAGYLTGWGAATAGTLPDYFYGTARGEVPAPAYTPGDTVVTGNWGVGGSSTVVPRSELPGYVPSPAATAASQVAAPVVGKINVWAGMGEPITAPATAGIIPSGGERFGYWGGEYTDWVGGMKLFRAGQTWSEGVAASQKQLSVLPQYQGPAGQFGLGATGAVLNIVGGLASVFGSVAVVGETILQDLGRKEAPRAATAAATVITGGQFTEEKTERQLTDQGWANVTTTTTRYVPNILESVTMMAVPSVLTYGVAEGASSASLHVSSQANYAAGAGELVTNLGALYIGARGFSRGAGAPRTSIAETQIGVEGRAPALDYRVVAAEDAGQLGHIIVNRETGSPLPGQLTDIAGVDGIPTSVEIPRPRGAVNQVLDSFARSTPEYYTPGEGSLLYQRPVGVVERTPGRTGVEITQGDVIGRGITGERFVEPVEGYVEPGSISMSKPVEHIVLSDWTEPVFAAAGERPQAGARGALNAFGERMIDIAPKTSDEQFLNPVRPAPKGRTVRIEGEQGAVEMTGGWSYTSENYLAGGVADILFQRTPTGSLDVLAPRPGAVYALEKSLPGAAMAGSSREIEYRRELSDQGMRSDRRQPELLSSFLFSRTVQPVREIDVGMTISSLRQVPSPGTTYRQNQVLDVMTGQTPRDSIVAFTGTAQSSKMLTRTMSAFGGASIMDSIASPSPRGGRVIPMFPTPGGSQSIFRTARVTGRAFEHEIPNPFAPTVTKKQKRRTRKTRK
jgi:hypothetical protein